MEKLKNKNLILGGTFAVLYFALFAFLCFEALTPGQDSADESSAVTEVFLKINAFRSYLYPAEPYAAARKLLGHYSAYALLSILGSFAFFFLFAENKFVSALNIGSGFIVASATEILQIFAEERGPSFLDVLVNFEGFLSGTLIALTVFTIIALCRSKDKIGLNDLLIVFGSSAVTLLLVAVLPLSNERAVCFKTFLIVLCASTVALFISYVCRKKFKNNA